MAATYTQDDRIAQLITPLGKDVLLLNRMDAVEGVSEPFEIRIEALSLNGYKGDEGVIDKVVERIIDRGIAKPIDFDPIRGQTCSVVFDAIDGKKRFFHGVLTESQWVGTRENFHVYRLVLKPKFWLLSFNRNMRIFHEKTVVAVLREVLAGIPTDFRVAEGDFPKMEYCVQFRESDFAFACRLMEQHGICFSFNQLEDGEKMVLWNTISSLDHIDVGRPPVEKKRDRKPVRRDAAPDPLPVKDGERAFISNVRQHRRAKEHFHQIVAEGRFSAGKTSFMDYNFKTPPAQMEAAEQGDGPAATKSVEIYDFPGKYGNRGDGKKYAKIRMESERAADGHTLAEGECISCLPGRRVKLRYHPNKELNREYLILRATHNFIAQGYRTSGDEGDEEAYSGHYELFDSRRPYRAPMVTEKPSVRGPQTAKVVGKGEIDVDGYGRILVRYYWDRTGANSCRVRVAQTMAGPKWGTIYTPRVGMEVIVDFLEGDPDRPIVIGCVYNDDNQPPFMSSKDGPAGVEKNMAGIKTNSTTGGGGYNELVMDDSKGEELVRFQAQYDLKSLIKHDEERHVINDRKTDIDQNETLKVGQVMKVNVGEKIEIVCGLSKLTMEKDGTIKLTGKDITISGIGDVKLEGMKSVTVQTLSQLKTFGMMVDHQGGGVMTIVAPMVKINS